MQDGPKAVWSISYVSVSFFPSHSGWISKMQSGREDTLEEWYAIKFCLKESAFLKFTSSDNQDLVVCIPILAVAVPLNLKA